MSSPDEYSAKSLFWAYDCNRCHLDRDGMLDEFHARGGGSESEQADWRAELIALTEAGISAGNPDGIARLISMQAVESLGFLLNLRACEDGYGMLLMADALVEISRALPVGAPARIESEKRARALCGELLDQPFELGPPGRSKIGEVMSLHAGIETPAQYIRLGAAETLAGLSGGM